MCWCLKCLHMYLCGETFLFSSWNWFLFFHDTLWLTNPLPLFRNVLPLIQLVTVHTDWATCLTNIILSEDYKIGNFGIPTFIIKYIFKALEQSARFVWSMVKMCAIKNKARTSLWKTCTLSFSQLHKLCTARVGRRERMKVSLSWWLFGEWNPLRNKYGCWWWYWTSVVSFIH